MKIDVLAFGAHPDDVELSCSGTLMQCVLQGKTTGIIDLTRGELGTRGNAQLRAEESAKASQILQLRVRENLDMKDGFFGYSQENLLKVIEVIRKYQPDIVFCNAIKDRHPDHGRGSHLVSEACFYAGLTKIETIVDGQNQAPWRPKAVYHYIQDRFIEPDFLVDITEAMEAKIESILAYSSQFYDPNSKEPETPISSLQFLNMVRDRNSTMGRIMNVQYAEGFTTERYVGVKNIFDLL
jgi:bacillithiol biosynthesis deacetylase BshB1